MVSQQNGSFPSHAKLDSLPWYYFHGNHVPSNNYRCRDKWKSCLYLTNTMFPEERYNSNISNSQLPGTLFSLLMLWNKRDNKSVLQHTMLLNHPFFNKCLFLLTEKNLYALWIKCCLDSNTLRYYGKRYYYFNSWELCNIYLFTQNHLGSLKIQNHHSPFSTFMVEWCFSKWCQLMKIQYLLFLAEILFCCK